jgi:predicted transcriptional regulator
MSVTLEEIIQQLDLKVLTTKDDGATRIPTAGYTSDLLSCVMHGAQRGGLWVTLQAHLNIVAVAALLDLAAVVITEGAQPDADTLAKANEEGVTLLSTHRSTFYVVGQLWKIGLHEG